MAWRCAQPGAAPGSIQCTASFLLRLPRLENQSVMAASPWPPPWGLHQCPRACRRLLRGVLHPPDPPLAASILRCTLAEAAREGQEAQPQGEGAVARLVQGPTFRISLGVGACWGCRPATDWRRDISLPMAVARASPSNCDTGRFPPSPGHRACTKEKAANRSPPGAPLPRRKRSRAMS